MVVVDKDVDGKPLPCQLYLDGYMKGVLDDANQLQKHNWDCIGFYIGYEGDGKTTDAAIDCLYMDYKFNLDKVVFNSEQFEEVVDNCEDGASILWDESDDLGANWASEMLLAIKRKFKRIRMKRLFIALATPTIFDMNKYFAIHRTRYVVHVYAKGTQRGQFRFFNRDRKKDLYLKGKKDWDMGAAKPTFIGRFTKWPEGFPLDMKEYEAKKEAATKGKEEGLVNRKDVILRRHRLMLLPRLIALFNKKNVKVTNIELSEVFMVDNSLIGKDLNDLEEAGNELELDGWSSTSFTYSQRMEKTK